MEMALALVRTVVDGFGNFVGWVLIGFGGAVVALVRMILGNRDRIEDLEEETEIGGDPSRLERHEERMETQEQTLDRIERYMVGDPDDPSDDGLLHDIHQIKQIVEDDHDE